MNSFQISHVNVGNIINGRGKIVHECKLICVQCKSRLAIQDYTLRWLNRITRAEALILIESVNRGGWIGVLVNLGQMMRNYELNYKYTICNQEWARIPREGSGTTLRDSSKLRVEVLLEAFLIQHKCGYANNTKRVYEYEQVITMRDIRELREKIQTQT